MCRAENEAAPAQQALPLPELELVLRPWKNELGSRFQASSRASSVRVCGISQLKKTQANRIAFVLAS